MKTSKNSLILIALAYPIAHLLTIIFQLLSDCCRSFVTHCFSEYTALIILRFIPYVETDICILSLVICINVFSVLLWWSSTKKD